MLFISRLPIILAKFLRAHIRRIFQFIICLCFFITTAGVFAKAATLPGAYLILLHDLQGSDLFITSWQTTTSNETITLPLVNGYNYNFTVDWGDKSPKSKITSWNQAEKSHTYEYAGIHTVRISGTLEAFSFNNGGDKDKIVDVVQWGAIKWKSFAGMFFGCSNLMAISASDAPDLKLVTSFHSLFRNAYVFNSDISHWDTSTITTMAHAFDGAMSFNNPLDSWYMGNVMNIDYMFNNASSFNQNLNSWDVSNITTADYVFNGCSSFNGNIASWDMSGVTSAQYMFSGCTSFNKDISGWNTSAITNMSGMFQNCTAFNQNLGSWDITQVTDMIFMLKNAGLSVANYDALLIGWEGQAVQNGVAFNADTIFYTKGGAAETARTNLINTSGWSIYDQNPFITTWQTTAPTESITLPLLNHIYEFNFQVDWGDGSSIDTITASNQAEITHTYATSGEYNVTIIGICEAFTFYDGGDKDKLIDVVQWGSIVWKNVAGMFYGCSNISVFSATDAPDLSQVTSFHNLFRNAVNFNTDISHWDTSAIITMENTFYGASSFNQPLNSWNMSSVTSISYMFYNAVLFNQDLNSWNLSSLTNTNSAFFGCTAFNGNITSWDMSGVTDATAMFRNCSSFNQDIGGWSVGNIKYMNYMLRGCTVFNQDISGWNTGSAQYMYAMFTESYAFDQNLGSWDISSVIDMSYMLKLTGLSTANYDATLIGWEAQTEQPNVTLGADGLTYTSGGTADTARSSLIANGWTINGDSGI